MLLGSRFVLRALKKMENYCILYAGFAAAPLVWVKVTRRDHNTHDSGLMKLTAGSGSGSGSAPVLQKSLIHTHRLNVENRECDCPTVAASSYPF